MSVFFSVSLNKPTRSGRRQNAESEADRDEIWYNHNIQIFVYLYIYLYKNHRLTLGIQKHCTDSNQSQAR